MCTPIVRTSQRLLGRSEGVSRAVVRCYRAESPTVINGVAKSEGSRSDDVTNIKSVEDIPGPRGRCALPYIGSMFLFHPFTEFKPEKSNLMFEELHRRYGRIVKFRRGRRWSVVLFDPDLIEEAISLEGDCPIRPAPPLLDIYSNRTKRPKGLSLLQGEEWQRKRRPVQEFMLQQGNISQYTPGLDEVASELVSSIQRSRDAQGRIPVDDIVLRYAIESSAVYCINARIGFLHKESSESSLSSPSSSSSSSSSPSSSSVSSHLSPTGCPYHQEGGHYASATASSLSSSSSSSSSSSFRQLTDEEKHEMIRSVKMFMQSVANGYYTFPTYKLWRTKLYKDFEYATNYLSSIVMTRVSEMAKSLQNAETVSKKSDDPPNLLQSLLGDGRLDPHLCTSMLALFFTTATDNISNSLGIVLWHLAKNPEKQEKLREEILQLVPSKHSTPYEVLAHMPYLKSCLKESHRMTFPSSLGSLRVLPEDVSLGGYHIPAGTWIHFGQNILGHSPEYFEKPEEYMPERWLKSPGALTNAALRRKQSMIVMPFGFGKRNCVGRRLAEQQIYLAMIKILQNYRLTLSDANEELDVVYKMMATSSKPLDIRFSPLH